MIGQRLPVSGRSNNDGADAVLLTDVMKPGNLIYLTYFNVGLRVYDIKDPKRPVAERLVNLKKNYRQNRPAAEKTWWRRPRTCWSTPAATSTSRTITWGCGFLRYSGPNQPTRSDR